MMMKLGRAHPHSAARAIPQLLNYLTVTKLPLGLVLFFGPTPTVRRVIRDDRREYPIQAL